MTPLSDLPQLLYLYIELLNLEPLNLELYKELIRSI